MTKQEFAEKYGFNSSVGAFGISTEDCRKELLTDLGNVIKALGLTSVRKCICKIPNKRVKCSENGIYSYCADCGEIYKTPQL